jgi:rubredoxin
MCSFGANAKKLYECRVCGVTTCPHLCAFKELDRTAVCHKCLATKREEIKR